MMGMCLPRNNCAANKTSFKQGVNIFNAGYCCWADNNPFRIVCAAAAAAATAFGPFAVRKFSMLLNRLSTICFVSPTMIVSSTAPLPFNGRASNCVPFVSLLLLLLLLLLHSFNLLCWLTFSNNLNTFIFALRLLCICLSIWIWLFSYFPFPWALYRFFASNRSSFCSITV